MESDRIDAVLSRFLEFEKAEREQAALQILYRLNDFFEKDAPEEIDVFQLLVYVVLDAVWADGEANDAERRFVGQLFEGTEEQVNSTVDGCKDSVGGYTAKLIKIVPEEQKNDIVTLCLCVVASDGEINFAEESFITDLVKLAIQ